MTVRNLALFCDFENVALGVKDEKFPKFDISLVLERLLVKGNVVCLLYTSPSPRDLSTSRMPSSA